jgi:hypothetical protein
MNASQRRIARRSVLSVHPLGSAVMMPTGKPATVIGTNGHGSALMVRRADNRRVSLKLRDISGPHAIGNTARAS